MWKIEMRRREREPGQARSHTWLFQPWFTINIIMSPHTPLARVLLQPSAWAHNDIHCKPQPEGPRTDDVIKPDSLLHVSIFHIHLSHVCNLAKLMVR